MSVCSEAWRWRASRVPRLRPTFVCVTSHDLSSRFPTTGESPVNHGGPRYWRQVSPPGEYRRKLQPRSRASRRQQNEQFVIGIRCIYSYICRIDFLPILSSAQHQRALPQWAVNATTFKLARAEV